MSLLPRDDVLPEREGLEPEPRTRAPWTKRVALLLLPAGTAIAAAMLVGKVPREREVELRLDDPPSVLRLDLTWTDPKAVRDGSEATPLQGSSWRFAEGTAPRSLQITIRLPDGSYDLEIAVGRTLGRAASHRTITLGDAERITLPVR